MSGTNMAARRLLLRVLVACAAMVPCAAQKVVYISPNNDGIQDQLEVPLQIKEKRYITEWSFVIFDEHGKVVRVISNKEKRPDKVTVRSFLGQLAKPKEGVDVPSSVIWNGYFDDGSLAPDGTYYYQFTATDDNGNTATTSTLKVIVDCTAPHIQLVQPTDEQKTFGEGDKSSLRITQSGSAETLWTASIADSDGTIRRTFKWEQGSPLSLDWDGTDDGGHLVPDGVYTYRISATDEAGNTSDAAQITNIIYSAQKPQVEIAIAGSRYFSPDGDGVQDTVTFALSVPEPAGGRNALVSWGVDIVPVGGGAAVRSFGGTTPPQERLVFDGRSQSGAVLAEGQYVAVLSARYLNGYESGDVTSPVFVLDATPPSATVTVSHGAFSPDGDGNLDTVSFEQRVTAARPDWAGDMDWTGRVVSDGGRVVRTYDFAGAPDPVVVWDGLDASGRLVPDGTYRYELLVSAKSGVAATFATGPFVLDTSATELALYASPLAFSLNPQSMARSVTFSPVVKASSGIRSYTLSIQDAAGRTVRTMRGTGSVPAAFVWDGTADDDSRCDDGTYGAVLETVANSGTRSRTERGGIVLDSVAPEVALSVPYTLFSPDKVSDRQSLPVTARSSEETKWTGVIVAEGSPSSVPVRTFTWYGTVPSFDWDGTDESGNVVANGRYALSVYATDAASNTGRAGIGGITVDTREAKAFVTAQLDAISPNGDGFKDSQQFALRTTFSDGIQSWRFQVVDSAGGVAREWSDRTDGGIPQSIVWDGMPTAGGSACEGQFWGRLSIQYEKGNAVEASSSPFVCTATPPVLSAQTSPRYFSPDNDGNDDDLYIRLKSESRAKLASWTFRIDDPNGNEFWTTGGKSAITDLIVWDGRGNNGELVQSAMDYPYTFTVTDELGMTSSVTGSINVDVLVIRVGDVLKMQVPSIIFRGDSADFGMAGDKDSAGRTIQSGITAEQKANNERVLRRIAEILSKFQDYNVTIVGHANRLTDSPDEETVDNPASWGPALIPLSLRRAEYVKGQLVSLGIAASRLQVEGKGGTDPVADSHDRAVSWKNRRVEFILHK